MKNRYEVQGDTTVIYCESKEGIKECYIDTCDLPKLLAKDWTWRAYKDDKTMYAKATKGATMHRIVMDAPKGTIVDHKDRNGLNNRRQSNLRLVTASESVQNRSVFKNSSTGYPGVSWAAQYSKWKAKIRVNGKEIYLGRFDTIEEAVEARRQGELKYWTLHSGEDFS